MIKSILSIVAVLTISITAHSQCVGNEANVYSFVYEGNNYEIVKENLNWVAASACAVERGGMLTEIDSQGEQDSIFINVNLAGITAGNTVAPDGGNASYLWIGGNDIATEGEWVWDGNNDAISNQFWQGTAGGNPVGGLYNNWGNEPDNWNEQDGLGLAFTDWPLGVAGEWNDVDDGNTLYYIIEYDNTNVNEFDQIQRMNIYPNPTTGEIKVEFGGEYLLQPNTQLKIYDERGEMLKVMTIAESGQSFDISDLPNGTYFVSLEGDDGNSTKTTIVINK